MLIIDDMIASGESMLDTARELKDRKAKKVIICCTFSCSQTALKNLTNFTIKAISIM